MRLTGAEIDGFLEHSVSGWFNTMKSPGDYMLRYRTNESGEPTLTGGRLRLREPVYNFDSAAGINYTVDVSKESGDMVEISTLTDGRIFHRDSTYTVAINSYRGSGGGGHIRNGAGLSAEEALERLIFSTERDLRFYFIEWIEKNIELKPATHNNWKVIPESWYKTAVSREYKLIYGE